MICKPQAGLGAVVGSSVLELYGLLWESWEGRQGCSSSCTQGQDTPDPFWFLARGQEAAGSGLGFTSAWMPAESKVLSPFPKDS